MATQFVPLTLATGPAPSAGPGAQPAFQPLANAAPPSNLSTAGLAPAHSGACAAEPSISVEREGSVITRIRVKCICGHVLELACEYAEPNGQTA
jgi:hypothetical protein